MFPESLRIGSSLAQAHHSVTVFSFLPNLSACRSWQLSIVLSIVGSSPVFYTSGSTGTPKGAMFTESLCIGTWLAQSDQPVITLSYMPMSHLIGYGYVILTLANGGTSYFAAKSDLSTLFEDLALVRPTSM